LIQGLLYSIALLINLLCKDRVGVADGNMDGCELGSATMTDACTVDCPLPVLDLSFTKKPTTSSAMMMSTAGNKKPQT
jgi:hypothetical protein